MLGTLLPLGSECRAETSSHGHADANAYGDLAHYHAQCCADTGTQCNPDCEVHCFSRWLICFNDFLFALGWQSPLPWPT